VTAFRALLVTIGATTIAGACRTASLRTRTGLTERRAQYIRTADLTVARLLSDHVRSGSAVESAGLLSSGVEFPLAGSASAALSVVSSLRQRGSRAVRILIFSFPSLCRPRADPQPAANVSALARAATASPTFWEVKPAVAIIVKAGVGAAP
jgi:hypothetical protein